MVSKHTRPARLGTAGARLWRQISGAYVLRADELAVLESACRVADTLARLDAALVGAPLTVRGSQGQEREHPLLSEARQQRALLGRLLHQLALPDDVELGVVRGAVRAAHARKAAQARWARTDVGGA